MKLLKHLFNMLICTMMGAVMVASDIAMEALPNIHIVAVLIIVTTVVYRAWAILSVYIYVILIGLLSGFGMWWVAYLYVWTILWAITMLLPKKMPPWLAAVVYTVVCGAHGFAFGFLCALSQAPMLGVSVWAYTLSGIPFDIVHGISNLCLGTLIVPLILLFQRLDKLTRRIC